MMEILKSEYPSDSRAGVNTGLLPPTLLSGLI